MLSVNLMTCIGSLTNIARQRPQFMDKIVTAFEVLHGKNNLYRYFVNYH